MNERIARSFVVGVIILAVGAYGGFAATQAHYKPLLTKSQASMLQAQAAYNDLQPEYQALVLKTTSPVTVPVPAPVATSEPAQTTTCPITTCADGSCSSSTGRGTCSYHGGEAN